MDRARDNEDGAARAGVLVHRMGGKGGGARGELENTLAGLDHAIARGESRGGVVHGIEYDVRRTVDGVLVIHHDPDIDGVVIADAVYAELPRVQGEPALTFIELLDRAAGSELLHDVEIKPVGITGAVLDTLRDHDLDGAGAVITSFLPAVLHEARELGAACRLGLLIDPASMDGAEPSAREIDLVLQAARFADADFVAPHATMCTDALLAALADAALDAVPWTVNDPDELGRLLSDPRVSCVITDHADAAANVLERPSPAASDGP